MPNITLTLPARTIAKAKRLAKERKISVSALVGQIIQAIDHPRSSDHLTPKTREASGLVKWPNGKNHRRLIEEAMVERHLKS